MVPNVGPMVVGHFMHPVALLTHSNLPCYHPAVDHMTVQPRVNWAMLCFPLETSSNQSTLSQPADHTTTWKLWNHQWAITTCAPLINEGLGKRTLPITDRETLGECRYLSRQGEGWCSPTVVWEGAISRRNYSEKEELTSQEGCMSLKWERWPQTSGEA